MTVHVPRVLALVFAVAAFAGLGAQTRPAIPAFWDTDLLHDYELPLATPSQSPTHVSRDYYYALAERPLFKSYPIYHPDREPAGYLERLRAAEPERAFDPANLNTDADWIAAGRDVFEMPIDYGGPIIALADVRDPAWYARHRMPTTSDGTLPFARYVVREKGKVEVGNLACSMCHTRVMPGVLVRQGTSLFSPPAIPDLIGLRDRKYLDKTGLGRHRGVADIMRYAAMNQTLDVLGNYGGFVPAAEDGRTLAPPGKGEFNGAGDRYSDAQLFALAQFIYSLAPPPNPNPRDARAARGEAVFAASGCARCHTPPLYTANKLVPAEGFTPPPDHLAKYDVLDVRVGTDPALTMTTRRGTGYYKIPSLKGVWYRGPFEHNGSVATLEDWFDPRRMRDDYVPTGFKGAGITTRAVKGHPFGLALSAGDREALIAFLKTL